MSPRSRTGRARPRFVSVRLRTVALAVATVVVIVGGGSLRAQPTDGGARPDAGTRAPAFDVLVTAPATWVRGAGGTAGVTGGVGAHVGVTWHRALEPRTAVGLGARAAWSPVAASRGGARWAEGSSVVTTAVALLAWQATDRLRTSVEAGAAHVAGPSSLAPFASLPAVQPAAALTVAWSIGDAFARERALLLRADWLRAGGAGGDDPVGDAGSVWRASAGIRWTP